MLFHVLFHGTYVVQGDHVPKEPLRLEFIEAGQLSSPGVLLQLGKHPELPELFYPMSTASHVLQRAPLHLPVFRQDRRPPELC